MTLSNAMGRRHMERPRSDIPKGSSSSSSSSSSRSSSTSTVFSSETSRMALSFAALCIFYFLQQVWLQGMIQNSTLARHGHKRNMQQSTTASIQPRRPLLPLTNASGWSSMLRPKPAKSFSFSNSSSSANINTLQEPYHDPTSRFRTRDSTNEDNIINTGSLLIYFLPGYIGQGTGNIISGVLAAILLGEEFGRTVCILGYEESFDKAFRWRDLEHWRLCESALKQLRQDPPSSPSEPAQKESPISSWPSSQYIPAKNSSNTIVQNNYDQTAIQSECDMKNLLSDHQHYPVLYYQGNTYPRWPPKKTTDGTSRDIFHEYFEPTQALLRILPWKVDDPPSVVVHLRQGDGVIDVREGLDERTLSLLATYNFSAAFSSSSSSSSTPSPVTNQAIFLVTNRVEWYDRFAQWSHPSWSLVHHSALLKTSWGPARNQENGTSSLPSSGDPTKVGTKMEESLQMWADWYTLLRAQRIYHTHSDFSLSASRWNQRIVCWTIRGSESITERSEGGTVAQENISAAALSTNDTYQLVLTRDEDGPPVRRLVDRTKEDLLYCDPFKRVRETKAYQDMKLKEMIALGQRRRQERDQLERVRGEATA